jgi:hypothetical protein
MKYIWLWWMVVAQVATLHACSCFGPYETDFFKNVKPRHEVVFAVVQKTDFSYEHHGLFAHTAYLTVLDTLSGARTAPGRTMVVTGQDGLNCGEILDEFHQGDTLVLALDKGFYYTYGMDTFYLDGCRKQYHHFKTGGPDGVSISWLKERIRNIRTGTLQRFTPDFWLVYPNPANDVMYADDREKILQHVQVMDLSGRLLTVESIRSADKWIITTRGLLPGLYLLIMYGADGRLYQALFSKI